MDSKSEQKANNGGVEPNENRKSPPRSSLPINAGVTPEKAGVNPEKTTNERTIELATDQSIAARHLLYYPNQSSLEVIARCADGIDAIMKRLKHTDDNANNLQQDEILISMCTRLMADGGAGRLDGFNSRLSQLVEMQNTTPRPEEYNEQVHSLANECRENMVKITTTAVRSGTEGALARQAILAFMGDLGGLEPKETGFGSAYKGPLCNPQQVYQTFVTGVCDAQRQLLGNSVPADDRTIKQFEHFFHESRKATSMKGGGLSAPAHTAGKKEQRAPVGWSVQERRGLLNTGDRAEERLKMQYSDHKKSLRDASWPSYLVSEQVIQNVVEPVTGHISGTFGEMATTMNLFCGTPPNTVTWETPSGTPIPSANKDQVTSIAALSAAGLISAGFHSAVEVFQPMSTFTTHATHGSLGPSAVVEMNKQANALRSYAKELETLAVRPNEWIVDDYALKEDELLLTQDALLNKAESLENAATKSVDMISVLQGEGGTIATLEVSRVMANHSENKTIPFKLYSLSTKLEDLGLRGHTPELERVREAIKSPVSSNIEVALQAAIAAAERKEELHNAVLEAEQKAKDASVILEIAKALVALTSDELKKAEHKISETAQIGWSTTEDTSSAEATKARANLPQLEEFRAKAWRARQLATSELKAAETEATASNKEATVAQLEVQSIVSSVLVAAKAEATAARKEAMATRKELVADNAELTAADKELKAAQSEHLALEKQQELERTNQAIKEAVNLVSRLGIDDSSTEALKAKQRIDSLKVEQNALFHEFTLLQKEALVARAEATDSREEATKLRDVATQVRGLAGQTRERAQTTETTALVNQSTFFVGYRTQNKQQRLDANTGPVEPEKDIPSP